MATTRKLWIIETGDYEERYVFCVCETPSAGFAHVIATFGSPYVVAWRDIKQTRDDADGFKQFTLTGDFSGVHGFSTQHTANFDATEICFISTGA